VKGIKSVAALLAATAIIIAGTVTSFSYPPFLSKAKKYGAKNCTFCHVNAQGGQPFNARGKWLMKEKARRNADIVDPEWIGTYNKGAKKK
jgi:hypothetical protein